MPRSKLIAIAFLIGASPCFTYASEGYVESVTAGASVLTAGSQIDDREVYVVTSKVSGWLPKIGPVRHASVAICPKGVSPVIYKNGVAVSNSCQCDYYGTDIFQRKFEKEGQRVSVRAVKVCGANASKVECNIRNDRSLNLPLLNDCRHQAIRATGLRGHIFKRKLAIALP